MFEDEVTLELWSAIHRDEPQKLRELLKEGADVNKTDRNGQSLLHAAVSNGFDEVVKVLIRAGADVDGENENGQTALHLASSLGHTYIVMRLLKAGCDVNKTTKYSEMTALHMASRNGHTDVVRLLMEHGADHCIKDAIGKQPEFYAGSKDISQIFKQTVERPFYRRLSQQHKHLQIPDPSADNSEMATKDSPENKFDSKKKAPRKKKVIIIDHKMEYSDKFKQRMGMSVFDRLAGGKK